MHVSTATLPRAESSERCDAGLPTVQNSLHSFGEPATLLLDARNNPVGWH